MISIPWCLLSSPLSQSHQVRASLSSSSSEKPFLYSSAHTSLPPLKPIIFILCTIIWHLILWIMKIVFNYSRVYFMSPQGEHMLLNGGWLRLLCYLLSVVRVDVHSTAIKNTARNWWDTKWINKWTLAMSRFKKPSHFSPNLIFSTLHLFPVAGIWYIEAPSKPYHTMPSVQNTARVPPPHFDVANSVPSRFISNPFLTTLTSPGSITLVSFLYAFESGLWLSLYLHWYWITYYMHLSGSDHCLNQPPSSMPARMVT